MRLFYYDERHQQVIGDPLDLGDLGSNESTMIENIIEWLYDKRALDSRYKCLELANNYDIEINEDNGFPEIKWR